MVLFRSRRGRHGKRVSYPIMTRLKMSEQPSREVPIWQIKRDTWLARQPGYEPIGIFLHISPSQYAGLSKRGKAEYERSQDVQIDKNEAFRDKHRDAVIEAYFRGEPVPREVLDDYRHTIAEIEKNMELERQRQIEARKPLLKSVTDFSGPRLKKNLNLLRAIKAFGGQRKDGSGAFGYTLVKEDPSQPPDPRSYSGKAEDWYTIHGEYDPQGKMTELRFGPYGSASTLKIPKDATYEQAIEIIKAHMGR